MTAKPKSPMKRLVVLEESTLLQLASNAEFTAVFPFLSSLATAASQVKASCRSCGGGAQKQDVGLSSAVLSAKQMIAGMADDQKNRMKAFLNTEKLRVSYREGNRIVQQTF